MSCGQNGMEWDLHHHMGLSWFVPKWRDGTSICTQSIIPGPAKYRKFCTIGISALLGRLKRLSKMSTLSTKSELFVAVLTATFDAARVVKISCRNGSLTIQPLELLVI